MAENSTTDDGRQSWLVLARRCTETAAYLEETLSPARRPIAKASAAGG
jgi:hypothetical protein